MSEGNTASENSGKKGGSLAVPGAIVLAGVLIAGAVLFNARSEKPSENSRIPAGEQQEEVLSAQQNPISVQDLAGQIGLDMEAFTTCLDSGKYVPQIQADTGGAQEAGVSGTPSYFINGRLLVGAQPYSAFQAIIEEELSGERSSEPEVNAPGYSDLDASLGDPEAPVKIVEFSEFLCPFCAASAGFRAEDVQASLKSRDPNWEAALPAIKRDYIDTGKVFLAFRHFAVHGEEAVYLSGASLCANEQGKFWELHDALFANQANLVIE